MSLKPRGFSQTYIVPASIASARLRWVVYAVALGFVTICLWCYIRSYFWGNVYPLNTFLFRPEDRFRDFANMLDMSKGLNPYESLTRSAYPPFANLFFYLFSLMPSNLAFVVYTTIPVIVFLKWGLYISRGLPAYAKIALPLLCVINLGVIYAIDRGNLELYVAAFLVGWWWLYNRYATWPAVFRSVLLGAAIAMKLYPALLLILLIKERRWRELIVTVNVTLALTILSAATFSGGPGQALHDWLFVLQLLQAQVAGDINNTNFGIGLFGSLRLTWFWISGIDVGNRITAAYSGASLGVLLVVFGWLWLAQIERWKVLLIAVVGMLILPTVSYEYKLSHLLLLLPALLWVRIPEESRGRLLLVFALLLVPKNYFIINGDVSIASALDPLLLILLALWTVIPDWDRRLARHFLGAEAAISRSLATYLTAVAVLIPLVVFVGYFWNATLPIQEGWFHYFGRRMNQGDVPYRDFYSFIQPLPLWHAAWVTRISDAFIAFRVYGFFERIVLACILVAWLRRHFSTTASTIGAITGLFLYQSNTSDVVYSYYQTTLLLFLIGAFCMERVILRDGGLAWAFASGAAAASAFMCKQSSGLFILVGLAAMAAAAAWLRQKISAVWVFSAGVLSVLIPILFLLFANGSIKYWWAQIFMGGGSSKGSLVDILFNFWDRIFVTEILSPVLVATVVGAVVWTKYFRSADIEHEKTDRWIPAMGFGLLTLLVVFAVRSRPAAFAGLYDSLNGNLLKITVVSGVFVGMVVASVIWWFLLPRSRRWNCPLFWSYGSIIGLSSLWMYAHGMSFMIEEHACIPALPFMIAAACDRVTLGSRFWRLSIIGTGCLYLVSLTAIQHFRFPYNWWGSQEAPVYEQNRRGYSEPVLYGFNVAAESAAPLEQILKLVRENTRPGDSVFSFPHILFFNVLTKTVQPTFAKVHYFDVCPDDIAKADAIRLGQHPPRMVIWLDMPDWVWDFHEQAFRGGRRSGQRELAKTVMQWLNTGEFNEIGCFTTPGVNWKLRVLLRNP